MIIIIIGIQLLREWMYRLVNRMKSDSSQSEDDNSVQTLFPYVDDKDVEAAYQDDDKYLKTKKAL